MDENSLGFSLWQVAFLSSLDLGKNPKPNNAGQEKDICLSASWDNISPNFWCSWYHVFNSMQSFKVSNKKQHPWVTLEWKHIWSSGALFLAQFSALPILSLASWFLQWIQHTHLQTSMQISVFSWFFVYHTGYALVPDFRICTAPAWGKF